MARLRSPRRQAAFLGLIAAGLGAASCLPAAEPAAPARPNVIVILVDDLGWRDLSCQGSPCLHTPHVDALAAAGMRFTTAYAACTVCSPTRAALLTGLHPARLHVTDWIPGHVRPFAKLRVPDWTMHLPAASVTVAQRLAAAGYATAAIGKWHLGTDPFVPRRFGFDVALGGTDRGQPPSYFAPYRIPTLPDGPPGEYLTDRESDEAVRFIEAHRDRPFFLYLPHHAVHTPLEAPAAVEDRYARLPAGPARPRNTTYAAMVACMDDAVGRIIAALDRLGLRDRTAIVFTSDNGGLAQVTDNVPLRAGKGSAYEGGVRVPLVVSWPGVTRPGSTSDVPVITHDLPATILAGTGVGPDSAAPGDGRDLTAVLAGGGLDRDALHWHYPHYHPGGATPHAAIRSGVWRLVHFYEDDRDELYDLAADPGETLDLAAREPARTAALRGRLDVWLRDVGGQRPTANPRHDAARDAVTPPRPATRTGGDRRPE